MTSLKTKILKYLKINKNLDKIYTWMRCKIISFKSAESDPISVKLEYDYTIKNVKVFSFSKKNYNLITVTKQKQNVVIAENINTSNESISEKELELIKPLYKAIASYGNYQVKNKSQDEQYQIRVDLKYLFCDRIVSPLLRGLKAFADIPNYGWRGTPSAFSKTFYIQADKLITLKSRWEKKFGLGSFRIKKINKANIETQLLEIKKRVDNIKKLFAYSQILSKEIISPANLIKLEETNMKIQNSNLDYIDLTNKIQNEPMSAIDKAELISLNIEITRSVKQIEVLRKDHAKLLEDYINMLALVRIHPNLRNISVREDKVDAINELLKIQTDLLKFIDDLSKTKCIDYIIRELEESPIRLLGTTRKRIEKYEKNLGLKPTKKTKKKFSIHQKYSRIK